MFFFLAICRIVGRHSYRCHREIVIQLPNHLCERKSEQASKGACKWASMGAGKQASKGEGNWTATFHEVNLSSFLKKWKINVFPYNFLLNQDGKSRKVAIKREFQELSKHIFWKLIKFWQWYVPQKGMLYFWPSLKLWSFQETYSGALKQNRAL